MADSQTYTPASIARALTAQTGKTVTPKAVRSWVRDHVVAYSKADHPEYQSHVYDEATARTIVAGMLARGTRGDSGSDATALVAAMVAGDKPAPVAATDEADEAPDEDEDEADEAPTT